MGTGGFFVKNISEACLLLLFVRAFGGQVYTVCFVLVCHSTGLFVLLLLVLVQFPTPKPPGSFVPLFVHHLFDRAQYPPSLPPAPPSRPPPPLPLGCKRQGGRKRKLGEGLEAKSDAAGKNAAVKSPTDDSSTAMMNGHDGNAAANDKSNSTSSSNSNSNSDGDNNSSSNSNGNAVSAGPQPLSCEEVVVTPPAPEDLIATYVLVSVLARCF